MTIETVSIDSLSPDPANARAHSKRNLAAIRGSLQRFGQQKPIVVDGRGVVRAGNGTLEAARTLGWQEVRVVRTTLEGSEATAYAIADNRTADLAGWDDAALADQLAALRDEGIDLAALGFNEKEIDKLLHEAPDADGEDLAEQWLVVVTCEDEADQSEFLEEMETAGRDCRAVVG